MVLPNKDVPFTGPSGITLHRFTPHKSASALTAKFRDGRIGLPADLRGGFASDGFQEIQPWLQEHCQPRRRPVRSSYMGDLYTCPRKFMWRVRYGLKVRGWMDPALHTGTFFHEMLRAVLTGSTIAEATSECDHLCQQCCSQLEAECDRNGMLPSGKPLEDSRQKCVNASALAKMMFELSVHPFLFSKMMEPYEVLTVEAPIEVKYRGIWAPIRCKPDALLMHRETGDVLVVNHKTTGERNTSTVCRSYPWALQPQLEHLCVRTVFPDAPNFRYLHNIMRKCSLRYPSKNSPTWEAYLENARAWYLKEGERDPANQPMLQSLFLLPSHPMTAELHVQLYEASRACYCDSIDTAKYPKNAASCFAFHKPCPFLSLCESTPGLWPRIIEERFEQVFREDEEDEAAADAPESEA